MDYDFNESIGWHIYQARVLMKNKLHRKLKQFAITAEQWSVLMTLHMKEGYNQKELAEKCLKDRAALTRILDILEKKELIERQKSLTDRREYLIYITDKGHKLYDDILPVIIKNAEENVVQFSNEEVEQLQYLLKKLNSNLE
ncbi:MarR family transcriptional regulator [Romboutsia sp.]|uniref:MarR family winged helix-turn-helix transcriptional regulator n=1 Tax=Romboutsia sp. TaxID=1965302 RepID=UPI002B6A8A60|nr:MarR family transcriptional regulator [Romboutsia sp.]HSQ87411.1 MarR family transcriptional regulator [Romboutsia sp.]